MSRHQRAPKLRGGYKNDSPSPISQCRLRLHPSSLWVSVDASASYNSYRVCAPRQGLSNALIGLCFSEIAPFVQGCEHYLRQRREMAGAFSGEPGRSSSPSPPGEVTATTDLGRKEDEEGGEGFGEEEAREGAGEMGGRFTHTRSRNASSGVPRRAGSFAPGPKGAKKKDDADHQRFSEVGNHGFVVVGFPSRLQHGPRASR